MTKQKDVNDAARSGGYSGRGEAMHGGGKAAERRKFALAELVMEKRCQTRAAADNAVVAEYRDIYRDFAAKFRASAEHAECPLPPIEVFLVKGKPVVTDGFHRVAGAVAAPIAFIEGIVVGAGTMDEAALRALGANRAHGLRRSNADKRRAVMLALDHPKLKGKSDRELAEVCGVSHVLVADVRGELETGWDRGASKTPPKPAKSLGGDRGSAGLGRQVEDSSTSRGKPAGSLDPDLPFTERRQGKDGKQYPASQPTKAPPPTLVQTVGGAGPDTGPWDEAVAAVKVARLRLQQIERDRASEVGQAFRQEIAALAAMEAGIERSTPELCPRCKGKDSTGCKGCHGKKIIDRSRAQLALGLMQREGLA